jgi:nucleoside-diphosphate-sugar epimerase
MKIFITGASGFIGGNLQKHYRAQEHDTFAHKRWMDAGAKLDWFKPDLIVNCAAEIYNPDDMWTPNVELVKQCLDYQREHPCQMIQFGSSSEYGEYDRATREADPITATDLYSTTKGIATMLCQTYGQQYGNDVVVIRPYSPYGPGEKPHRLFPRLWRAFKSNEPMTLVNGVHDFCYIDDFVQAVDVIANNPSRTPGEIVNVSTGVQTTNHDVYNIFKKITGRAGAVTLKDDWVTPNVWCANIHKVTNKFNWQPQYTIEQGIEKFLSEANYE